MNEKTLEGYHATTIKRSEIILKDGFKISKSNADTWEWLGDGVYFWEDDYYAVQWNVIDIEKNKTNLNEYAILKSIIKVNKAKLFEMSSPEGSIIYNELRDLLINKLVKEGFETYVDKLLKKSDKFWVNLLEDNGFFDEFDVVTAVYKNEKNIEKYKDDIILNVQKQICVKNDKCIKKTMIYEDKERILNLFSIIFRRRKEIKNEKIEKIIK